MKPKRHEFLLVRKEMIQFKKFKIAETIRGRFNEALEKIASLREENFEALEGDKHFDDSSDSRLDEDQKQQILQTLTSMVIYQHGLITSHPLVISALRSTPLVITSHPLLILCPFVG